MATDEQRKRELIAYETGYESRNMEVRALRDALGEARDELVWAHRTIRAEPSFLKAVEQANAALDGENYD